MIDITGKIWVCGANDHGQLGLDVIDPACPQMITPVIVPNFTDCAKQVVCGEHHTLILSLSGLVYAVGDNREGQLGFGNRDRSLTFNVIEEIAHMPMRTIAAGSFSGAISEADSSLFLWGTGSFGEFLSPHRVKRIQGEVISVSIGNCFGAALTAPGFLYSWGDNSAGQLGFGDFLAR